MSIALLILRLVVGVPWSRTVLKSCSASPAAMAWRALGFERASSRRSTESTAAARRSKIDDWRARRRQ